LRDLAIRSIRGHVFQSQITKLQIANDAESFRFLQHQKRVEAVAPAATTTHQAVNQGEIMPVKVIIPTPLRQYTEKKESLEVQAKTVAEALVALIAQYGDLRKHLYSDEGKLRSFVNIYVGDEDIRFLQKEQTPLKEDDVISIVPSIAGGTVLRCICS
jgi:molybdopterin synthase sulfur carrier subunit